MAHAEQKEFCEQVKQKFPAHFKNKWVLDCGSLDINGNNRYLFEDSVYLGIDVGSGPNVDIVTEIHKFSARSDMFDVVISTECFEHDMHWKESFINIVRMLKPGGLFLFTCATTGRAEHGTCLNEACSAPLISTRQDLWAYYYKNLTAEDYKKEFYLYRIFEPFAFSENTSSCDLYFYGIKKHDIDLKTAPIWK
jgi:SAM-dependent methyltransferase